MKPKKHKKWTPGQEPLTPSPSQAPEILKQIAKDSEKDHSPGMEVVTAYIRAASWPPQVAGAGPAFIRYDNLSALFQSCIAQPQGNEPAKSVYCHEFRLVYNGPDGPLPVSQGHISLTAEQIPTFSTLLKNFRPYLPDDAPLTWFKQHKHPGRGQPPGTKATFWAELFEKMLDARDTLVAARKNVTQRALLDEMGYPASPTKTLRRWLEAMEVSWDDFKQRSR